MRQILLVSGTRPEIIKLAPLFHALKKEPDMSPVWLHTGQHDDMATQILACFGITPDITLARGGSSLVEFSTHCRLQLDREMGARPWSLVIVQGDTESAFLGALSAFHRRIPVAHVEAGLRTGNLDRPFPEEGLRQMIARIATLHFPPTQRASDALLAEAIPPQLVHITGNTVVDAQHWTLRHHNIDTRKPARRRMLVTAHRRENWGREIEEVCGAIADLANRHPDLDVIFPVHLNPVVQKPVSTLLGNIPNVQLLPPLDYLEMQQAIAEAWVLLTDSGGLQEEAPTFGVPVLVLREETERPEAVEAGCAKIVGTQRKNIVDAVETLWQDEIEYTRMSKAGNPFGDGHACRRIMEAIRGDASLAA